MSTIKQLFSTPMNQLELGKTFNKFFENDECGQPLQIPVMTVGEFFLANNSRFTNSTDRFICSNAGNYGFSFQSWECIKLIKFFRKARFTYKHWVMLLPKKNGEYDLSLLSKEQISALPFYQVCGLKTTGFSFQSLAGLLIEPVATKGEVLNLEGKNRKYEQMIKVTVGTLLALTRARLQEVFVDSKGQSLMTLVEMQRVLKTVEVAQRALVRLGFDYADGPFVLISSSLKMIKVLPEWPQQLELFFPQGKIIKLPIRELEDTQSLASG